MKKLLLLILAACLPFSMALAQDPGLYHIWFGNVDGSAVSVGLDKDISIPVWGSTDPTPGNPDTINFWHMPLMSDDQYITARTGGTLNSPYSLWDDISFLTPDHNAQDPVIPVGFTSQSILGFAWLSDPRDQQNWFYTLGVPTQIGTYRMHTVNNPALIGTTVPAFSIGHNAANGGLLWGVVGGSRSVVPPATFSELYFSPNQPPVFESPQPGATFGPQGCQVCFPVLAHDTDEPFQTLTITADHGGVFTGVQDGGTLAGTLCFSEIGVYDATITLSDGTDQTIIVVHVNVTEVLDFAELTIPCGDAVAPGSDVEICIQLNSYCQVGGFEIMICWDCTALTLTNAAPTTWINEGWEYFNWVHDPMGCGSARFVWIADTPERGTGAPYPGGDNPIICLTFHLASGLPFSAEIPITFCNEGPNDYTSNTISDRTGNYFFQPTLNDGCIYLADPATFRGDPNMNCFEYEVADAVLVARRLIYGRSVWAEDDNIPNVPPCDRHHLGNDQAQEAAADLNGNGYADIADLVRFVNILNGFVFPKTDPAAGQASFFMNDGAVRVSSNIEVGGALVKIAHSGEIGTPVAANGMDILSNDANGVLSVVVYSQTAKRIPAGDQPLFTLTGTGTITEASAADSYGELMESRVGAPLPTAFSVDQNYPNPFNGKTLIKFALPNESDVNVNIYSVTGQLVETLKGHFAAGEQSIVWDANVSSGVYFAKVSAGSESRTLRMTLLK